MCGLCGILGGQEHWTDAVAREGVYTRNHSPQERRRERANRIRTANEALKIFGLKLEDWQSNSYILRTVTGTSEVFDSLNHLWPTAEKMVGRPCDPLNEGFIKRLEERE
ncbi:MAG: hypothetical protein ACKVQA_00810 [Burkholderiales bacterium]